MKKLIALLVATTVALNAVDINVAWDNPEEGTYDGVEIYAVTKGVTNTFTFSAGVSNAIIQLPRASVSLLSARAWAEVTGTKLWSVYSDTLQVRIPANPSKPSLPRKQP